ncbi:MAG: DUF899 domain-containing protein, partial [Sphingomonadales bacterium]
FATRTDLEMSDLPGTSAFVMDADGTIYHSYSSYGRGLEAVLPVYGWLDMAALGRNEGDNGMGNWMRRHDEYPDDGRTRPTTMAETSSCCAAAS